MRAPSPRSKHAAFFALASLSAIACANTSTWNGDGFTPRWDEPLLYQPGFTNWDLGTTQLPGPNDTVIFGSGFESGNPNLNGSREVGTLVLDTSTTFSFEGNPVIRST